MSVTATYTLEVDWDGDGVFEVGEDVTADLISVDIDRGLTDPLRRVAKVGRLNCVLRNTNRAYSPPLNANALPRRQCRFSMTYNSITTVLFRGFIEQLAPDFGQYRRRQISISAVDAISLLQLHELRLALQLNKRGDELISAVVADCYTPPGTAYDVDLETFPFGADQWSDDVLYGASRQRALNAIGDICRSNWGWFYIRGDGYAVFENRHHRLLDTTTQAAFSDTMMQLQYKKSVESVYNEVEVVAHPRTVGGSNEVLWQLEVTDSRVDPSTAIRYNVRYRDPDNKDFDIGGKDMISPVSGADYQMTSQPDGAGSDVTANFTVSATLYANGAEIVVTNNSASQVGYINLLRIRGLAVRVYAPPIFREIDSASQAAYQKRALKVDAVLQDDQLVAQDQAKYLIGRYATPLDEISGLSFWANSDATRMGYARDLEISSRISLTEYQTGLSGFECFVQSIRHAISQAGRLHRVEIDVEKADAGDFWLLGTSTLGVDTRLAY